jgi:hypothetical protein
MTERAAVRWGVPALLAVSCVGAAAVSLHARGSDIPGFAFGSHVVLAVQIALIFFYGGLLLLVPLVRALSDGHLPIELSLRGARWTEEALGFGEVLLARQADAEARADQNGADLIEEVRLLRERLAFVEKVGSRKPEC